MFWRSCCGSCYCLRRIFLWLRNTLCRACERNKTTITKNTLIFVQLTLVINVSEFAVNTPTPHSVFSKLSP